MDREMKREKRKHEEEVRREKEKTGADKKWAEDKKAGRNGDRGHDH